jgi:type II secretory pathway component PulF
MNRASSEEILAVHEELAALVRSGLPLGSHVKALSHELPARLRPQMEQFTELLDRGESVDQALHKSELAGNSAYAAVFAVALRGRHPARALESMLDTEHRALQFQQSLAVDFIYPAVVLSVGLGLLSFSWMKIFPVMAKMSDEFYLSPISIQLLANLVGFDLRWGSPSSLLPLLCLLLMGYLVVRANFSSLRSYFPWQPFQRLRNLAATGVMCDTLAMLVENEVPLPQALLLTSSTLLGTTHQAALESLSKQLQAGQKATGSFQPISPFVLFVLQSFQGSALAAELRREAIRAREELDRQRRWHATYLPMCLTLIIGLSLVFLLALIHWGPVLELYFHLAQPLWDHQP